jgi:hypothetical protein
VPADPESTGQSSDEAPARAEPNGSNGSRKSVAQTAALAVAASAAALAAKRMFSEQAGSGASQHDRAGTHPDDSLASSMLASGWRAAQDSLLPVAEEAAATAGAYLARSGPEIVRERLLPRFISGFERGRSRAGSGD